jgi:hypothetical protein
LHVIVIAPPPRLHMQRARAAAASCSASVLAQKELARSRPPPRRSVFGFIYRARAAAPLALKSI